MNRQETAVLLRILRTVWPNTIVDDDTITAYQWAFDDVNYDLVEDAAKRWMKTGKFFPKPAELLEIIAVQTVAPGLIPEAAFDEVIREAGRVGVYGTPEFSNPLIGQAARSIGWRAFCLTDESDYPTLRAQFREALKAMRVRAINHVQIGDKPDALTAIIEQGMPALPGSDEVSE